MLHDVICVGGLIAAGKTTFIESLKYSAEAQGLKVKVMPELWNTALRRRIHSDFTSVDAFMLAHRLQMSFDVRDIAAGYDLVLMERSFVDHLAFHEAFAACGTFTAEFVAWSKEVVDELKPPVPGRFVFLDVDP